MHPTYQEQHDSQPFVRNDGLYQHACDKYFIISLRQGHALRFDSNPKSTTPTTLKLKIKQETVTTGCKTNEQEIDSFNLFR